MNISSKDNSPDKRTTGGADQSIGPKDILLGLAGELLAIDPDDKESIVDIGTRLEGVTADLRGADAAVAGLLDGCLDLMQRIYMEQVPNAAKGLDAIATSAQAVADHLFGRSIETERQLAEARRAVTAAMHNGDTRNTSASLERTPAEPAAGAPHEQSRNSVKAPAASGSFDGPAVLPIDTDTSLLGEFITECLDHIALAEGALLALETNPDDNAPVNVVFRAFHTIKGTSAFLGLDRIQRTAHLAEGLLSRAREGEIRMVGGYADLALKSCDALRIMIEGLKTAQPGKSLVVPERLEQLLSCLSTPEEFVDISQGRVMPLRVGDILVAKGAVDRETVERAAEHQDDRLIGEVLVRNKAAKALDVADAICTQEKLRFSGGACETEATVRVGVARLDSMIDIVGELVIAQSMVAADPIVAGFGGRDVGKKVSHVGKIVRQLQDLAIGLRMVPLKPTFQKMARVVRDLGKKSGKSVTLVTNGEETEIDRNIVEALNDPLVHMIRNACDHGIESAEERIAAGKSSTGTVVLRAYHSAGKVVIQLRDDGRGLDRDKILSKAIDLGLADSDREMTDADVFMLIFRPGFSTTEEITDVSGRGVGMDVVRKAIESLQGRVEVESTPGVGTTFSLRLPLTMAITDAMLLAVGEQQFLLPTISIEHSFRPAPGSVSTVTGRGEVVMLRGDLLPVFRLYRLFNISGAIENAEDGLLLAIEGNGKRCALMVDQLLGEQQVVIKSLGSTMVSVPGVSGGAILGDGRVGLILDAGGLVSLAEEQGSGVSRAEPAKVV